MVPIAYSLVKEKCDPGNWSSSSCADRLTLHVVVIAGGGDEGGDDVDDDVEAEQESPLAPLFVN